jgi:hypothetical protein
MGIANIIALIVVVLVILAYNQLNTINRRAANELP